MSINEKLDYLLLNEEIPIEVRLYQIIKYLHDKDPEHTYRQLWYAMLEFKDKHIHDFKWE